MLRWPVVFLVVSGISMLCVAPSARADDDPWIARDKAQHFDVSMGIAAAGYALSTWKLTDSRGVALAIAGSVTLAIGAGKEGVDALGFGSPSWKDFAWDAIGTVAGLAIAWGVDLLLGGVGAEHPAFSAPQAAQGALVRF